MHCWKLLDNRPTRIATVVLAAFETELAAVQRRRLAQPSPASIKHFRGALAGIRRWIRQTSVARHAEAESAIEDGTAARGPGAAPGESDLNLPKNGRWSLP